MLFRSWEEAGGTGQLVQFADLEKGWRLNHPDLFPAGQGATTIQALRAVPVFVTEESHGTNVLGILVAQDNGQGCVGISRDATAYTLSMFDTNSAIPNLADAIALAQNRLNVGDVLLIEAQLIKQLNAPIEIADGDQRKQWLVPVEFDDHIRARILEASTKLVIIEAAGNGNMNLDDVTDSLGRFLHRPEHADKDTGAILVAAGGQWIGGRYQREQSSNYGSRIDCHAQGSGVTTTHYRPDAPVSSLVLSYLHIFARTSASEAIIA